MRIVRRISGSPVKDRWMTFEVELDETDLERLLRELQVDPSVELTSTQAFLLLDSEAERMRLRAESGAGLMSLEEARTLCQEARERQRSVVDKVNGESWPPTEVAS